MRLIDADVLLDNIRRDSKKAIDEGDEVGSFWLGYAAGLVIKQPSIQPERAEGEWIVHLYKVGVSRYECDACHARCDIIYPYCPYCGEKKEGERDATN